MSSRKYVGLAEICWPEFFFFFGGAAPEPPRGGLFPPGPPEGGPSCPHSNPPTHLAQALKHCYSCKEYNTYPTLSKFTQIRDELAAVGEIVDLDFLVRTSLNDFTKPWGSFVRGIVAQEVMPTWERLWDDFVQEELRCSSGSLGQQRTSEGDEDLSLWTKGKKKTDIGARQGPKGRAKPQQSGGGIERDMSIVRCFACGEMGYYAGQCPKKKKKKKQ
jgi:hypothetical protein